jgi:hypothetical protein
MSCLIAEFARCYDVFPFIFAAIFSGPQVLGSALEAVERPGSKMVARCEV